MSGQEWTRMIRLAVSGNWTIGLLWSRGIGTMLKEDIRKFQLEEVCQEEIDYSAPIVFDTPILFRPDRAEFSHQPS